VPKLRRAVQYNPVFAIKEDLLQRDRCPVPTLRFQTRSSLEGTRVYSECKALVDEDGEEEDAKYDLARK
jgi:hypothetical protein